MSSSTRPLLQPDPAHRREAPRSALRVWRRPLRRLQRIERGPLTPIVNGPPPPPPQTTTFAYVQNGDLRRLKSMTTAGVVTETYGYDSEERLASVTQTFATRPGAAFTTEQFYDAFSRPYQIKYPARVGIAGDPRRTVTYIFGADGRPRQVLVDSNSRQPGPVSPGLAALRGYCSQTASPMSRAGTSETLYSFRALWVQSR